MKSIVTFVALLVVCMNVVSGDPEINELVCRINGENFGLGDPVGKRIDGCNNCMCATEGFACTRMACPWYKPPGCEIQGQQYNHYDTVPSDDCGECLCMNGNLACTSCPA